MKYEIIASKLVSLEKKVGKNLIYKMFEGKNKKEIVFIIGHMRSGSSLVSHIIFSNSAVIGYGETHNKYEDVTDFGAVAARICRKTRQMPLGKRYFLDKVLHKEHIKDNKIMNHDAVSIVFITRRPDHAMSSIVENTPISDPKEAYDHYVGQVKYISKLSRTTSKDKWIHVSHEDLIKNTASTFNLIEDLMDLPENLSESYEITKFTGKSPIGDPGPNISKGRIKRDINYDTNSSVTKFIKKAKKELISCISTLEKNGKAHEGNLIS